MALRSAILRPHRPIFQYSKRFLEPSKRQQNQTIILSKSIDKKDYVLYKLQGYWQKSQGVRNDVLIYGVLFAAGDYTQQKLMGVENVDWRSVRNVGLLCGLALAPPLHFWYRYLDRWMPQKNLRVMGMVKKVVVDQLATFPACVAIFFTGLSIMDGNEDIFEDLRDKFCETWVAGWQFWLPAQWINFALLPTKYRLAYISGVSYIWSVILCYIKDSEVTAAESQSITVSQPSITIEEVTI